MRDQKKYISRICLSFLTGSVVLIAMSFIQKVIAGFNLFALKGYLVAVLFGGTSGAIVGIYMAKVETLNVKLQQRVNTLENFLPICSNCKKIRKPNSDPKKMDSWVPIESYISGKTSSQFSHGICPECMKKLYGDILSNDE
ncbi:MAG: hypothetical protein U9N58_10210 [Thermodesulfobacteriota bacterium]|nr:hypothetical protein [Thermodesulfobacteriota bacterium]